MGQSSKLKPIWKGPFVVTKVISLVLFSLKGRKIEIVVHHDCLKTCEDRVVPMWARRFRHRTLDLDETLSYEVDEEDCVELAPLFHNLESTQNIEADPDLTISNPVDAVTSLPSDNSVDSQ